MLKQLTIGNYLDGATDYGRRHGAPQAAAGGKRRRRTAISVGRIGVNGERGFYDDPLVNDGQADVNDLQLMACLAFERNAREGDGEPAGKDIDPVSGGVRKIGVCLFLCRTDGSRLEHALLS